MQTKQTKQLTEARCSTTSFCELGKREKQALGLVQPALVTYMYVGKRLLQKEQSCSYPSSSTRLLRLPRYHEHIILLYITIHTTIEYHVHVPITLQHFTLVT